MRPVARLLLMLAALAPFGGCSSARLPVVPNPLPPLSAVVLSPDPDTLLGGEDRQFTAVALDPLDQPGPGAGFQWSRGDPGVVTVNLSGRGDKDVHVVAKHLGVALESSR